MVYAQIVKDKRGTLWIKVKTNYVYEVALSIGSVDGARYSAEKQVWAIPYSNKTDFENKVGNHLIIWLDAEGDSLNGGIDEEQISDQPTVEGYSVTYDDARNIIAATGFKNKPWGEFQVKGFNALVENDFLILADDAGLGKTYQVSTAMEARKKLGHLKHGIILAKASLIYNWRDEIHMHTNEKAVVVAGNIKQRMKIYDDLKYSNEWTFLVLSYETFRGDLAVLQLLDNTKPLDFCVADEAHKLKNPLSKIGTEIHKIPFKFRYILTATPLINNPLEGYNYLKFGKQVDMDWFSFRNHFAILGGFANQEIKAYQNILELKLLIQENMLRRRKKDKLKELPDVTFKTVNLEMSPSQKKLYVALRDSILEDLKDSSLDKLPKTLAKMLRLQQACNSAELLGVEGKDSSVKLNALDDMLDELIGESNEKVIVFSRFKEMADILNKRYSKYNPAVVTGDVDANGKSQTTALRALKARYLKDWNTFNQQKKDELLESEMSSERQKQVYKFQNNEDCKLFIGSSGSCREGLTLTKATHVIFIDCEWSPAYVEQAWSRAHRIGQKNAVTVYYLVAENTIDEYVQKTLRKKESMAQTMIDEGFDEIEFESAKKIMKEMIGA